MDYYYLDAVSWQNSQMLYHAAAHLGREALFILRPATPYVCLGYHQDAEQEIDLDFARQSGIPVFRREVGGGAVYLDGKQLFYQLVIRYDHPGVPAEKAEFYHKYLQPVIDTYRAFGVAAEYKPINDIIANGRKISGNGAAQIDDMLILVGNFIQDFDYSTMTRILRVPDEKFRDKVYKTMTENLTTIRRETGVIPSNDDLAAELAARYTPLVGELTPRELDPALIEKAEALFTEMNQPEWLFFNDLRGKREAQVKIAEGVYVIQKMYKAPGGLIRVTAVNRDGRLRDVHISGDFFIYPADSLTDLEAALDGVPGEVEPVESAIIAFYHRRKVETPGVTPEDFTQALLR
jgi:lipoate-protein ligase A